MPEDGVIGNVQRAVTINQAIQIVLTEQARPLTHREIFARIVERGLYNFLAKDPQHVVQVQLRRHCFELDHPSASRCKLFHLVEGNKFKLPDTPVASRKDERCPTPEDLPAPSTADAVRAACARHRNAVRNDIVTALRSLSPRQFEAFARNLLVAYGFDQMMVTRTSNDGGIDGHGQLKVGISHINVAYQCKRWSKTIDRPQIDKFRGAIQGEYEQGLFFTTSRFTDGAVAASRKPGAVPITLFDAHAIVDIMFEKQFGVQIESVQIPIPALDLLDE